MTWLRAVIVEYRHLRSLMEGQSYGRVEAAARSVARIEQRRRFGEL